MNNLKDAFDEIGELDPKELIISGIIEEVRWILHNSSSTYEQDAAIKIVGASRAELAPFAEEIIRKIKEEKTNEEG